MKTKPRRPGASGTALLLIDVINDFDFPEKGKLLPAATAAARRIAALKKRFVAREIPIIYANDNFGRWRSDFQSQVQYCLNGTPGAGIARELMPVDDDYFVLKPKYSAFYSTALEVLLEHLRVRRIILTGFATDVCVLSTANDAYMRDYEIAVPPDCSAAESDQTHQQAIKHMRRFYKADTRQSRSIRLPGAVEATERAGRR